jgi:hypothetical protein
MKYPLTGLESNDEIPAKVRKSAYSQQRQPLIDYERRKKRDVANSNERRRMRCINNGFDQLKDCIPHLKAMDKISKAGILSHACHYLNHMQEQIKILNKSVQEARCLSCGHCPYYAADTQNSSTNTCSWFKQVPPLHVQVSSDVPTLSPNEALAENEMITYDHSGEEKPNTPNSDSTSAASMQANQVKPLSFTHLLQAVEVLHDMKFHASPVSVNKGVYQRTRHSGPVSLGPINTISSPNTQHTSSVISTSSSVNSLPTSYPLECRPLPPRLKNKWHIGTSSSQITS